jgi:hypothetical protein
MYFLVCCPVVEWAVGGVPSLLCIFIYEMRVLRRQCVVALCMYRNGRVEVKVEDELDHNLTNQLPKSNCVLPQINHLDILTSDAQK